MRARLGRGLPSGRGLARRAAAGRAGGSSAQRQPGRERRQQRQAEAQARRVPDMSRWLWPWSNCVKERVCRYLLHHYLGHFFQEQLSLEQLSLDLYKGSVVLRDIHLENWVRVRIPAPALRRSDPGRGSTVERAGEEKENLGLAWPGDCCWREPQLCCWA